MECEYTKHDSSLFVVMRTHAHCMHGKETWVELVRDLSARKALSRTHRAKLNCVFTGVARVHAVRVRALCATCVVCVPDATCSHSHHQLFLKPARPRALIIRKVSVVVCAAVCDQGSFHRQVYASVSSCGVRKRTHDSRFRPVRRADRENMCAHERGFV